MTHAGSNWFKRHQQVWNGVEICSLLSFYAHSDNQHPIKWSTEISLNRHRSDENQHNRFRPAIVYLNGITIAFSDGIALRFIRKRHTVSNWLYIPNWSEIKTSFCLTYPILFSLMQQNLPNCASVTRRQQLIYASTVGSKWSLIQRLKYVHFYIYPHTYVVICT